MLPTSSSMSSNNTLGLSASDTQRLLRHTSSHPGHQLQQQQQQQQRYSAASDSAAVLHLPQCDLLVDDLARASDDQRDRRHRLQRLRRQHEQEDGDEIDNEIINFYFFIYLL